MSLVVGFVWVCFWFVSFSFFFQKGFFILFLCISFYHMLLSVVKKHGVWVVCGYSTPILLYSKYDFLCTVRSVCVPELPLLYIHTYTAHLTLMSLAIFLSRGRVSVELI